MQFILLKKKCIQINSILKSILIKYDCLVIFFIIFLLLNNSTNYGRRHFKLFTNCHVSWDTLYVPHNARILLTLIGTTTFNLCCYTFYNKIQKYQTYCCLSYCIIRQLFMFLTCLLPNEVFRIKITSQGLPTV